ncbi:hypothetical protein RSOLAG22IIIB_01808 [Rhizoctonia solani]|uniref:Methyltransferase domain-containing protein n=1 Tax=Rhizoctonia solani TaxID=456999 RepID=A0A0K6G9K6_9AGAM|nr:hypothetical protein RSOLAG22IIIB_01808 [Rhizoctonia solani]
MVMSSPASPQRPSAVEIAVSGRSSRSQSSPPRPRSPSSSESIFQTFKPMGLSDVLESPANDGSETPRAYTTRRRVTSPDNTHPFQPPLALQPPPIPSPPIDLPRKHRSALRLSRLRPGLGKDDMAQLDATPTGVQERPIQRTTSVRRPGSAGGMQQAMAGSSKRGMRVRASSELTRPAVPLGSPPLRPLLPVPVSPGVQSSHSEESALADDSDVEKPNLQARITPKPSVSVLDSDILDRDDADRRRYARDKYFKLKGPTKERCHAFHPSEAPYPISYSHKILDHYNLEVDLSFRTIVGLTFHKLPTAPAKVLDLGCGTGYWIVKAAHQWTQSEFVGFDLVPIQPNLERVTSRSGLSTSKDHADLRLHQRIRWVHGNFLKKLPFQDNEFDFVRCRKIARGVPETEWDGLYEEIVRVMKPGAAFEHIEEDIIFPTEISNKPTHPPPAVYPTPSSARTLPTPPYLSSTSLPHASSSSTVRTPDQYRRSPSTSFSSVIESPVEGRNGVPSVSSTSSASLVGSSDPRNRTTLVVPGSSTATSPDAPTRDSRGSNDSNGHGRHQATDYSFHDPRVHSRLEELFISMHDAREINLKPLSLIPRLIQERMTGMVSSPPLNMFLPPRPRQGPIPDQAVGVVEIARASGEVLIKQLSKMRASDPEFDESLLAPRRGDEDIARFMTFDFSRMGSVAKGGGAGIMPTGQFRFELNWLAFHLSTAVSEVLACKEAIWEHLKKLEPDADRREFDAMVRQYQTDMQDRIGLSAKLRDKLHWGPPESDFMRTPEQRVFEEHYAQAIARDVQQGDAPRPPTVMKCFRSFVAFKSTTPPPPTECEQ